MRWRHRPSPYGAAPDAGRVDKEKAAQNGLPLSKHFPVYFFFAPFFAGPFFAGVRAGLACGSSPLVMVNMKGSGVYWEITPIMSMFAPAAGCLVSGLSMVTRMSALLAAWLSSLMATSMVLGSETAITLTGILNLASPFFSLA